MPSYAIAFEIGSGSNKPIAPLQTEAGDNDANSIVNNRQLLTAPHAPVNDRFVGGCGHGVGFLWNRQLTTQYWPFAHLILNGFLGQKLMGSSNRGRSCKQILS
jgi:hypothetical protein